MLFSFISWDPSRFVFTVPYIDLPITWYGCFFALGFFLITYSFRYVFKVFLEDNHVEQAKEKASKFVDVACVLFTILAVGGARLAYVFFYGWPYYKENPTEILRVWNGGLASHGGIVGVIIASLLIVYFYRKRYSLLTPMVLYDLVAVCAGVGAACIRLGNFMNQEITGIPTTLPWGVIFGHAHDNISGAPLHPVQIYESLFYATLSVSMFLCWRKLRHTVGSGLLMGMAFIPLFVFRILIEFLKSPQGMVLQEDATFKMGQLLSLPFLALGIFLVARYFVRRERYAAKS